MKPLISAKAKERQIESGGAVPQKSVKPPIDTQKELAKASGVSHDTIYKVEKINERASEELKEKLRTGETTINKAYQDTVPRKPTKPQKIGIGVKTMGTARVIAVVNEKGGVGKTTTVCNLSAGLRRSGYKTLMIDLDGQRSLSKSLDCDDEDNSIMLALGRMKPITELVQTVAQGDVVCSRRTIGAVDVLLNEADKQFALKDALEPVMGKYDYIILDCPPALSTITINALVCATEVIIPTEAKTMALRGVQEVLETVEVIKSRYNEDLKVGGILVTRYDNRPVLSRDVLTVLGKIAEENGTKVYGTPIRENIAIAESQAWLTDIFAGSPSSHGAEDYKALVDEVIADGK